MTVVESDVLDTRPARLAYPEAVQAEEHGECRVILVEPLGGEEKGTELLSIKPPAL